MAFVCFATRPTRPVNLRDRSDSGTLSALPIELPHTEVWGQGSNLHLPELAIRSSPNLRTGGSPAGSAYVIVKRRCGENKGAVRIFLAEVAVPLRIATQCTVMRSWVGCQAHCVAVAGFEPATTETKARCSTS